MAKPRDAKPQAQVPAATTLQARFNQGVALHQQGRLAEAERVYREVLRQQPNHFDALHLLGVIAIQTRQTEQGIELITTAIKQNAKVADAHSNLANALMEAKRPEEALASYDRAIALKPDYAEAYNNRGNALVVLKRPSALPTFDYHCPLLSLPLAFRTTLSNIPGTIPYLEGSADKSRRWKEKLGARDKLRVGWCGLEDSGPINQSYGLSTAAETFPWRSLPCSSIQISSSTACKKTSRPSRSSLSWCATIGTVPI
jgi:tetratricopeptide (TPR) repeat protein